MYCLRKYVMESKNHDVDVDEAVSYIHRCIMD